LGVFGETIEVAADAEGEALEATAQVGEDSIAEELPVDLENDVMKEFVTEGELQNEEDEFLLKLDDDDIELSGIYEDGSFNDPEETARIRREAQQEWQEYGHGKRIFY
jgi:hypothetical protein